MSTGTTTLADPKARAWVWPALFSLVAFAANSVFCRLALKDGAIDPASFTVVRLASGALFLLLLLRLRKPALAMGGSWRGGLALFLYAFLFSAAYLQLAAVPGNSSTSRPTKAISMPSSIRAVICSPLYQAKPNMVICTAPNSSNAPAPAPSCRYAAENRNA